MEGRKEKGRMEGRKEEGRMEGTKSFHVHGTYPNNASVLHRVIPVYTSRYA